MKNDKIVSNAYKLEYKYSSSHLMKESLKLLCFNKENIIRKLLFIVVEIIISILIAINPDTVSICKTAISSINEVELALYAIVFTGYALFQALIGKKMLLLMVETESEKEGFSYLQKSNLYFAKLMMIQLLMIVINLALVIILTLIPVSWCAFSAVALNIIISSICIMMILHFNFEVIWEVKSFVFNTFQLFNIHAMSRVIESQEDDEL